MAFHLYDEATWERAEYYHYYKEIIKTHNNLTVSLDVTAFEAARGQRGLKFYPCFTWAVMKAVNSHREFRMALNEQGQPGWYDECHPCYTILHKDTGTFSDVWTLYDPHFPTFYKAMREDMTRYADVHKLKPKPGKPDNFCSLSCTPWLSFTGYSCDTYGDSPMLFPVILFGKMEEQAGETHIPFNIWLHHAAADGWHIHLFLQTLTELLQHPESWMDG